MTGSDLFKPVTEATFDSKQVYCFGVPLRVNPSLYTYFSTIHGGSIFPKATENFADYKARVIRICEKSNVEIFAWTKPRYQADIEHSKYHPVPFFPSQRT